MRFQNHIVAARDLLSKVAIFRHTLKAIQPVSAPVSAFPFFKPLNAQSAKGVRCLDAL